MRKLLAFLAVGALLAACATKVPQTAIDDAKAVSYGLESIYVASVQTATVWAKQPRCGPITAPPPLCSTALGVLNVEAKRLVAKDALVRLNAVIATVGADPSAISAAIAVAREAVAAYQAIAGKG